MKLIFAIVQDEDSPRLMAELNNSGYRVTKLNSSGGFLRSGNTTLMIVINEERWKNVGIRKLPDISSTINTSLAPVSMGGSFVPYPVEIVVGGATIFVVNVEHFEKI